MTGFESMLATATPWIDHYGYAAVAVGVMLEGVGIPLPGATLMGAAALLAGQGELNIVWVGIVAWLAAVTGDNLGYWLGKVGGRRLLLRLHVSRRRLSRLHRFFRRFGFWLIVFGRFFDGTRQLDGLVAGSARMRWLRFLLADALGAAAWVSLWVTALYNLDRHAKQIHAIVLHMNPWVAVTAVAALLLTLVFILKGNVTRGGMFRFCHSPRDVVRSTSDGARGQQHCIGERS